MATPKPTSDQIAQASGLVSQYISAERVKYAPRAIPLSVQQKAALKGFFSAEVLDGTLSTLTPGGLRSDINRHAHLAQQPARIA